MTAIFKNGIAKFEQDENKEDVIVAFNFRAAKPGLYNLTMDSEPIGSLFIMANGSGVTLLKFKETKIGDLIGKKIIIESYDEAVIKN